MKTHLGSAALLGLLSVAGCTVGTPSDGGLDAGADDGGVDAGRRDANLVCEADVHLGESCSTTVQCSDHCFCNGIELCVDGVCVAGDAPCDDEIECTDDVCDEDAETCTFESDDAACADEDVCNGDEVCVPFAGCRPGLRLACSDGDPCTVGTCDPSGGCSYEVRDLDGDGYADDRCGGDDCLDDPADGASTYPGAAEVCDNGRDDNCDGVFDYREASCLGTNDDCASAETLAGPGMFVRTTRGLAHDYALGCRALGPDAVFRFTLTSRQDVQAQLSVDSGTGSVAIRPAASCDVGPDAFCGNESVLARDLAPGEYALVVKTGTPSSFLLALSFLPATPIVPVDVCNDTTFEIDASGAFSGFFSDVSDDYDLPCRVTTTAYRDAVYRLVLTETSDVRITADTSATTTYLSLVRDCTSPASSLGCVQGNTPEIDRLSLPPGEYFVMVEASSTTATTWDLTVDIQPAMPRNEGDSCGTAIDVTGATATVPISSLVFDNGTNCGSNTTSTRDANFTFTLTDTQDVVLTSSAGGIHALAISSTCGDRTTETFCATGTPSITRRFLRMAPGTYHVTVATSLASGDLTVSAMLLPPTFPPDNDSCAMPAALADGIAYRGDLLAAGDDVASCGPTGSPDALHQLVLGTRRNVTAVARRTDGSGEPIYLGLRTPCDAVSTDIVCTSGAPALLNRTLEPGTYYFAVESVASFVGPYSLTVYLADP